MVHTEITPHIARELGVKLFQVEAVISLLADGNTVPFIARYRKEATGELDEEQIRAIEDRHQYLTNLVKRQEEIIESISQQGKLTPELHSSIQAAVKLQELEDIYLPYRPKKRTRAQIARERGLEPLSVLILAQKLPEGDREAIILPFVNPEQDVPDTSAAIAGACDIIAETVAERADIRAELRKQLWQNAEIATELSVTEADGKEFLTYKEYREPVRRMPSHRILAVNRGETKKILKVTLHTPHEANVDAILRRVVQGESLFKNELIVAVEDGYKRLLLPSLERELRSLLTENAEKQAIKVFALNLRQLLLQPPLSGHVVMGLDPGYRTGCKMAVVNQTGTVLATGALFFTMGENQRHQAAETILREIRQHGVTLISIGNGTASYETEEFVASLIHDQQLSARYLITNEAGASVYSASKLAKDELPGLDVTLRGAVSIARRVQDPLAELVKIDPQSIGVGQYQHDVNQKELTSQLDTVVESCVNHVGVDLNTASIALLTHVAGINNSVAKNIVAWRDEHGNFRSRRDLMKVPRLGGATFVQCAGFLRLHEGENPLDNTPVHPESYPLAKSLLEELGFTLNTLKDREQIQQFREKLNTINAVALAEKLNAGEPTVRDILSALARPGRDPREELPAPMTRKNIVKLSDLAAGSIVTGTVHNVTDFGVFVDIGVKTNGLIHRSELSYKSFRHPLDVVSVGDIISCIILSVDENRNRIALSLKQASQSVPRGGS